MTVMKNVSVKALDQRVKDAVDSLFIGKDLSQTIPLSYGELVHAMRSLLQISLVADNPESVSAVCVDYDKLVERFDTEISKVMCDRDHAVTKGWYDKAARSDAIGEGIQKAKTIVKSGDFHL